MHLSTKGVALLLDLSLQDRAAVRRPLSPLTGLCTPYQHSPVLRRFWRFLLGPVPTPVPRIRDLFERQDALEGEISGLRVRIKVLEGQVSGGKRRNKGEAAAQDALELTNGDRGEVEMPPPLRVTRTIPLRGW